MSHSQGKRVFVTGGDRTLNFSGCASYLMRSLAEQFPEFRVEAVPIHSYRTLYGATAMWGLRMRTDPRPYFFMTQQFQNANWLARAVWYCAESLGLIQGCRCGRLRHGFTFVGGLAGSDRTSRW